MIELSCICTIERGEVMASTDALKKIKEDVAQNKGKTVRLKANRGRRRTFVREGILEQVYPNIFVVKVTESPEFTRRLSYSYSDLLTETVELTLLQSDEPRAIGGSA